MLTISQSGYTREELKQRGWTVALIRQFFGGCASYDPIRVALIEALPEWQEQRRKGKIANGKEAASNESTALEL